MFGGRHAGETDLRHGILGDALADGVLGSGTGGQLDGKGGRGDGGGEGDGGAMSTTQWLARRHGVKGRRVMYVLVPRLRLGCRGKYIGPCLKLMKVNNDY